MDVPEVLIRAITAEEARPLRRRVLRPHRPPEELVLPGDDEPGSLHAGAFVGNALVGIATVARQLCPLDERPEAWQLRGMAVAPEQQRRGIGAALIGACLTHCAGHGGVLLWCNGRTAARPFYEALGFVARGAEFVTVTGPHYVFVRDL